MHTRWIETEFDNQIEPYAGAGAEADDEAGGARAGHRRGRRQAARGGAARPGSARAAAPAAGRAQTPKRAPGKKAGAAVSGDALTSPMQGTIVKVGVEDGDRSPPATSIVVLEAMKMEQPLNAHKAGTVTGLTAEVGATVASGAVICEIKDAG